MLARLQHLDPSERRDLLSQRSDFAEKHHNLALGSQESTITEMQLVGGLHVKLHIVGDLTLDCDMQLKMSSNHEMNTTKNT